MLVVNNSFSKKMQLFLGVFPRLTRYLLELLKTIRRHYKKSDSNCSKKNRTKKNWETNEFNYLCLAKILDNSTVVPIESFERVYNSPFQL